MIIRIKSVKCGGYHNIIKTNDNCYYSFGSNTSGQCLCFVDKYEILSPILIPLSKIKQKIKNNFILDIVPAYYVSFILTEF